MMGITFTDLVTLTSPGPGSRRIRALHLTPTRDQFKDLNKMQLECRLVTFRGGSTPKVKSRWSARPAGVAPP